LITAYLFDEYKSKAQRMKKEKGIVDAPFSVHELISGGGTPTIRFPLCP
jgi:hypothetical protein